MCQQQEMERCGVASSIIKIGKEYAMLDGAKYLWENEQKNTPAD